MNWPKRANPMLIILGIVFGALVLLVLFVIISSASSAVGNDYKKSTQALANEE